MPKNKTETISIPVCMKDRFVQAQNDYARMKQQIHSITPYTKKDNSKDYIFNGEWIVSSEIETT